jgi:NADPH:quinone reductase-like Zn-dependent oxidoreductase
MGLHFCSRERHKHGLPQPGAGRHGGAMNTVVLETRLALDDLRVVERPTPTPGPRDLLLRMRAASLNYRDLAIARGEYGAVTLPLVPLSDGAGEVVATGHEVRRFRPGDLVCPAYVPDWIEGPIDEAKGQRRLGGTAPGVLAEWVTVAEDAAVRAPAHLGPREAATLPVAAVSAWQALFVAGGLKGGETVAVQGSGGASLFAVQLAHAAGARVLSLLRDPARAPRLEALGAEVVDASGADWPARLRAATGGRGVDLFLDVVGGPALDGTIAATRVGGTVLLFGFVGGTTAPLDLVAAIRRSVTLRAVSGGSRRSFEDLVAFLERHQLAPVLDRVFPWREVRQAYHWLAAGRPLGKVVLDLDPGAAP